MCLYTTYIVNPKYKPNKKNKGKPPKCTDKRLYYVPVSCGHCIECRKKKAREWKLRLLEEVRAHTDALFITLTLSNKSLKELTEKGCTTDNEKAAKAVRLWLDRVRKSKGHSIKHWLITELGEENNRIHIHGILWNCTKEDVNKWQYGFTYIGKYVNDRTMKYITKYMLKMNPKDRTYTPKIMCSSNIGLAYMYREETIEKNFYKPNGETDETYRDRQGTKCILPDYWRHKIYTEEEREKLWIEKQEKGERWILGQRVNIDNEEEYQAILKAAQRINDRLENKTDEEWNKEKHIKKLKRMREYIKNYYKKSVNK